MEQLREHQMERIDGGCLGSFDGRPNKKQIKACVSERRRANSSIMEQRNQLSLGSDFNV